MNERTKTRTSISDPTYPLSPNPFKTMTIANPRPAHPGFPEPERPKKVDGIQLQIVQVCKNPSNVFNANQTLRRHLLISQEHLSQDAKAATKEILGKGVEILNHQDEISDQIAEVFSSVADELDTIMSNNSQAFNPLNQKLSDISEQLAVLIQRDS